MLLHSLQHMLWDHKAHKVIYRALLIIQLTHHHHKVIKDVQCLYKDHCSLVPANTMDDVNLTYVANQL